MVIFAGNVGSFRRYCVNWVAAACEDAIQERVGLRAVASFWPGLDRYTIQGIAGDLFVTPDEEVVVNDGFVGMFVDIGCFRLPFYPDALLFLFVETYGALCVLGENVVPDIGPVR